MLQEQADFTPGTIVSHFKRELLTPAELAASPTMYLYEIIGIGTHTEDGSACMVYRALYGTGEIYVRPLEMFLSPVDRDTYPAVRQLYRFMPFCEEK